MGVYTLISMATRPTLSESDLAEVASECACRRLRGAARAITRLYDEALRPAGLRATQFTLLVAAELHGEALISELAETLALERTSLTREIKLLEEQGLVSITPGEDRRARIVAVTEEGRKALALGYPRWREVQGRVLGVSEQAGWSELAGRIAALEEVGTTGV
jgi:DNA-binding MarR family transcriptional regulator